MDTDSFRARKLAEFNSLQHRLFRITITFITNQRMRLLLMMNEIGVSYHAVRALYTLGYPLLRWCQSWLGCESSFNITSVYLKFHIILTYFFQKCINLKTWMYSAQCQQYCKKTRTPTFTSLIMLTGNFTFRDFKAKQITKG